MSDKKGRITSFKTSISRLRNKRYDIVTNFKVVKVCFLLLIPGYVGSIL